uniref:photosystem II protein Z n=1 Tax=Euglena agilis TaxID=96764 RepID=UPI0023AB0770|nr:photosystem II protein Z [Euglena agilis]WCH63311.1 photosystem II protein Z [Euglena agilis]
MLLLTFQASLLALVALSFVMVVAIPVIFASPNGWDNNRSFILLGSALWTVLVLLVGILNSFVI